MTCTHVDDGSTDDIKGRRGTLKPFVSVLRLLCISTCTYKGQKRVQGVENLNLILRF